MVSEQSILEITRSIADAAREVMEMLGSMKSNLSSLKEELRKEEECEDYDENDDDKELQKEIVEERSSDLLFNNGDTNAAKIPADNKPDREGKGLQPNPNPNPNPYLKPNSSPNLYPDPNSSQDLYPDPNPNPSPYPNSSTNPDLGTNLNPKSYSDLNQKLDTVSESGIAMEEEVIEAEHSDVKGDVETKAKKEENRRKITDEDDEDRSIGNLGRATSLLPISLASLPSSPLSRFSPPSPSPSLAFFMSSFSPPSSYGTRATQKSITRSQAQLENKKMDITIKPNSIGLTWPKLSPDPMILIWPKPLSSSINRRYWLVDGRFLPPISHYSSSNFSSFIPGFMTTSTKIETVVEPPPPPWLQLLLPLYTSSFSQPPLLILKRGKFGKKLEENINMEENIKLLDGGGVVVVEPQVKVHLNSEIGLINPKRMMFVAIIEGLCVVVLMDNGETVIHHYICKKFENKMGDSYEDFTLLSSILMVLVVYPYTYGLINPAADGNKNSTITKRTKRFLNHYNSVVSRLVGLDTRSEVVNFSDEHENEEHWLQGTEDTCLQGWKLNRKDLQSCEAYWRTLRWGTINNDDKQYAWESQVGGIQGVNKAELEFEEFIQYLRMIGASKKCFERGEEIPKGFPFDRGREERDEEQQVLQLLLLSFGGYRTAKDSWDSGWLGDAHRKQPPPPLPRPPTTVVDKSLLNRYFYFFPP